MAKSKKTKNNPVVSNNMKSKWARLKELEDMFAQQNKETQYLNVDLIIHQLTTLQKALNNKVTKENILPLLNQE